MIKAIFYDFDGVIKQSTDVKAQAFYDLYLPYGQDIADKVVDHHNLNGGVSRYEKFVYYHKNYLSIDLDKDELEFWASKFSDMVLKKVIDSPYVKHAEKQITKLSSQLKQFVITGTPQSEIDFIIEELGINSYFVEVCGSPNSKIFWSNYLMKKYNLNNNNVLFIGDSPTDYKAATECKLHFLLINNKENSFFFNDIDVLKTDDLNDLNNLINNFK